MSSTVRIERIGTDYAVYVDTERADGTHIRQSLYVDQLTAATIGIRLTDRVIEDNKRSS